MTAAYKQMEQSLRTGDGQPYLRLQPRDVLSDGKLQQMLQKRFPPDPSLRLGIDATPLPRIDLVEANSLAKILPYRIEPFVK